MKLREFLTYKKGRPVKNDQTGDSELLPILTPEYLRTNTMADLAGLSSDLVVTEDNSIILLWDGSNAGEFFKSKRGILASTMVVLDFNRAQINTDYLFYNLKKFEPWLKGQTRGSGIPHVDKELFLDIDVHFPTSKKEQQIIAQILITVDKAIEQTEALIAKHQRIKTGLMQDLLTRGIDENEQLRHPSTHKFKPSKVGMIPKEWEVDKLGSFLDRHKGFIQTGPFGSQLHADEYVSEGVPTIMPKDIIEGYISISNIDYITEKKAKELSRHRVQYNDVVFARRGDLSRAAPITNSEEGWLCGTGCFLLRPPKNKIDARWLSLMYRYHSTQLQVLAKAIGSTMQNLNGQIMRDLDIAFPQFEEQQEIVERLNVLLLRIRNEEKYKHKLLHVKVGLMHDLLTGRISVSPLLM